MTSEIDRKTASVLLGVSVRTIDRYIRRGKLLAKQKNGRIWLAKKEIFDLKTWRNTVKPRPIDTRHFGLYNAPVYIRNKGNAENRCNAMKQGGAAGAVRFVRRQGDDAVDEAGRDFSAFPKDSNFYRELYEETKRALHEAHYRIGQLESQSIYNTIHKPIERREDNFSAELLRKEIQDREKEIVLLKEFAKREKMNRIIFAVIAYISLILLPLAWFLLR